MYMPSYSIVPTAAPEIISVTNSSKDSTKLSIVWKSPPVDEIHGVISKYQLCYCAVNDSKQDVCNGKYHSVIQ